MLSLDEIVHGLHKNGSIDLILPFAKTTKIREFRDDHTFLGHYLKEHKVFLTASAYPGLTMVRLTASQGGVGEPEQYVIYIKYPETDLDALVRARNALDGLVSNIHEYIINQDEVAKLKGQIYEAENKIAVAQQRLAELGIPI